jgi:hypothetical protein
MSVRDAPKNEPYFPLSGVANDGWTHAAEATATCFCGAVQLAFPTTGPGLIDIFVCHCADCRKITASMFAANFTVSDSYLRHVRGQDKLQTYGQKHSIGSGQTMTNYFCRTCGTLMYRVGAKFPGFSILRLGTVDDFNLVEGTMAPRQEQYVKDRAGWLRDVQIEGIKRNDAAAVMYGGKEELEF